MSDQIGKRRKRMKTLLNFVSLNKDGVTKYQIEMYLFENYALGEKTIENYIQQLRKYQFIMYKGNKIVIGRRKSFRFW